MRNTPNGKLLTRVIRHILPIVLFLAWIFSFFPKFLQALLVRIYILYYSVALHHLPTICQFIGYEPLAKVFHMAFEEMDEVLERDDRVLAVVKDRVKLYYGASDRWAPVRYCESLKHELPGIDAQVCQQSFEHAFVLRYSKEVAHMVADWMIEARDKCQ